MIIADIHCHILPDVDDGAQSFTQSMDMLMAAYKCGTRHIVATPHFGGRRFEVKKDIVLKLTDKLNAELARRDINLTVYPGNEIRCTTTTVDSLREQIVCSVNQKKYLLVELPFENMYSDVAKLVLSCNELGHKLILAHPERYEYLTKDFKTLEKLCENGVLFQCNADSLFGANGIKARYNIHKMLSKKMVRFIASDCHSVAPRGPQLDTAYNYVAHLYGKSTARALFYDNPLRIIKGKTITK